MKRRMTCSKCGIIFECDALDEGYCLPSIKTICVCLKCTMLSPEKKAKQCRITRHEMKPRLGRLIGKVPQYG